MQSAEPFIPRPALAVRIGVTGTRVIAGQAVAPLRAQIRAVLAQVKDRVEQLAADPRAVGSFAPGPARLRLLSPLAEGADRLVAEEALALGYALEVPMPFAAAEYEKDFPETVAAFRALLGQAGGNVLMLDGARGEDEARSYEAVGRWVARNCDLLIAIWDGGKGQGRGGTAEIIRFAARHERPVWWLRADGGGPPCWIENLQDLRRREGGGSGAAAGARLAAHLARLLLPAPETPEFPPGVIGAVLLRLQHRHPPPAPLAAFLAEQPKPERAIWTLHRRVMRWAAGRPRLPPPEHAAAPGGGEVWPYWQRFYAPVDRLSVAYGNRYRSSYVMVFALAALALSCAVFGVGVHAGARIAAPFELMFLLGIFAIVGLNQSRRWHARWIATRLLAELFRKQQALALLGWSLPAAAVSHISGDTEDRSSPVPRDAMVGWYFNAVLRAAPLPQGALAGPHLAAAGQAIAASLLAGQAEYHAARRRDAETAAHRFGQLGAGFFLGTLALVLFKLVVLWAPCFWPHRANLELEYGGIAAGFVAVLLPALSAAFMGIRFYAELELLADQSAQMHRLLTEAERRLRGLDLDAPLASQALGAEILRLAEAMLLDVKGWAQLFRMKTVEAG